MTERVGVFEGAAPSAVPPGPVTVPGRLLRARTDIRFAILVGAVLASSVVAFSVVCAALPSSERLSRGRVDPCMARIGPATAWITEQSDRASTQLAMANACERPYVLHEAGCIAIGLMLEAAVAVLLYALHPWWPRLRRRPASRVGSGPRWLQAGSVRLPRWSRKVRLTGVENADVLEELDSLARATGLSRLPLWLVDPYATTTGGRAYGLPGRPRICLDVGLLVRYDLDREGFRAVVRHELAHHRHRDVGRTYLTVALWWSFVATALIPCVLLSAYPRALLGTGGAGGLLGSTSPGGEEKLAYRLVALVVLSATAYLARNMILRARELHADAVAHSWDSTRNSLPRMVAGLPWPCTRAAWRWVPAGWMRWAARAGTHPSPGQRVAAMLEPARLLRTGAWEMAGIGLLAGLAFHNLALLTGNVTGRFVTVGLTLLALPVGVVLALALASALLATADRRTPSAPEAARSLWDVVVLPAALTGGMVCSGKISLGTADLTAVAPTLGQYALIGLVQLGILLPLALWTRSVHRSLPPDGPGVTHGPRRRGIVVTAGVVWGPLLALWNSRQLDPATLTTAPLHAVPAVGRTIGWYTALTSGLADAYFYLPLAFVRATPFLPAGLVLVWAVPLLLARRRRGSLAATEGVGKALAVGLLAGLAAVAAGIALPYAARGALPPEVRRIADPSAALGTLPFSVVHASTYLAVTALLQAAAAAGTALVCRRLRPVLVPLAVTVTAVLGTLGFYVSRGTSLCVAVTGVTPDVCRARVFLPDADAAFHLHEVVAWGVVAAVPAGLLGAAVAALSGHRRRPSDGEADTAHGNARRRPALLATALGLLAALPLAGAAAGLPQDYLIWRPAAPAVAAQPQVNGQDASDSSGRRNDPCLLGSWRAFPARQRVRIDGSRVWLAGEGGTWTFRPDGTLIIDYGKGVSETATLHGRPVVLHASGSVTIRYRTANGKIGYYSPALRRPGELSLRVGETYVVRAKLTDSFSPDRFRCGGKAVHLTPASPTTDSPYELTLTRLPSGPN